MMDRDSYQLHLRHKQVQDDTNGWVGPAFLHYMAGVRGTSRRKNRRARGLNRGTYGKRHPVKLADGKLHISAGIVSWQGI